MTSRADFAILDELIDAGRRVVESGLVRASGGNLSARNAADTGFYVTASGTWLDSLTRSDFALMAPDGLRVSGAEQPSIEVKLHARTYEFRNDTRAIVHLHPQYVLLMDMLGLPIRFTTLDHQHYVGSVTTVPFRPAGSEDLADLAADAARHHNAVVLSHHGCSALGDSIPMALRRALNLEEAAQMSYRLVQAGDTTSDFPAEYVHRTIALHGSLEAEQL